MARTSTASGSSSHGWQTVTRSRSASSSWCSSSAAQALDGEPMNERPYLSIGEVLALLKDEFPDVTISKIRFLESQGLLDPERTPSGYRKFYEADVDRLRWILRQQREHFLPLKVIKGRLRDGGEPADDDGLEMLEGPETALTVQ